MLDIVRNTLFGAIRKNIYFIVRLTLSCEKFISFQKLHILKIRTYKIYFAHVIKIVLTGRCITEVIYLIY